ncbi:MAG: methyltransferase [Hyphomicrobiaceae bacterium]|nr:methyltransferase [Hyphomicrobiaceae bacterium]
MKPATPAQLRAFILSNTAVKPVPLVPEVSLHLADEASALWSKTAEELDDAGLPAPYWAFAWAGGQALARYVLDHPQHVRGRSVLDLGSGSGLVAIAALKAGAASVLCVDPDPFSLAAAALNLALNGVEAGTSDQDVLGGDAAPFAIVLIGDLFYEAPVAARVHGLCTRAAARGAQVLAGDPGRSYFPREAFSPLARYGVPDAGALEDADIKATAVWTFSG